MTEKEMLEKLLTAGTRLRTLQRDYFRSQDPPTKRELLSKSKQAEKDFDQLIVYIRSLPHKSNRNAK